MVVSYFFKEMVSRSARNVRNSGRSENCSWCFLAPTETCLPIFGGWFCRPADAHRGSSLPGNQRFPQTKWNSKVLDCDCNGMQTGKSTSDWGLWSRLWSFCDLVCRQNLFKEFCRIGGSGDLAQSTAEIASVSDCAIKYKLSIFVQT